MSIFSLCAFFSTMAPTERILSRPLLSVRNTKDSNCVLLKLCVHVEKQGKIIRIFAERPQGCVSGRRMSNHQFSELQIYTSSDRKSGFLSINTHKMVRKTGRKREFYCWNLEGMKFALCTTFSTTLISLQTILLPIA